MMPLTTYVVFDWLLEDSRDAIETRAELSGGTLVEMFKAADVEAERNAQLADATEAWSTVNDRDQTILARDEQLETLQHQLAEAQATIVRLEATGARARREEGVKQAGLTRDPAFCTHLWGAHVHGFHQGTSDAVCTRCGWCPSQQTFFGIMREEEEEETHG